MHVAHLTREPAMNPRDGTRPCPGVLVCSQPLEPPACTCMRSASGVKF